MDEEENDKGMKVHINKLGRSREHVGQAVSDDWLSCIKKAMWDGGYKPTCIYTYLLYIYIYLSNDNSKR